MSTIDDIIKMINESIYGVTEYEFLQDLFECSAIAISNRVMFDEKREKQYVDIMNKYNKKMQELIIKVFGELWILLSNQTDPEVGFNDYLGELYMKSNTSSSKRGQFFTPYHISKLTAAANISDDRVQKAIANNEIITLHEPTCGAGGLVIATADVLHNQYNFNYATNLLVECGDIDRRCVHMAYVQLSLAGIPAIVYNRDGLTLQTFDKWETPAYIFQYMRFKNVLKGVNKNG